MNLYTPLYCDDYNYCFIFGTQIPIRNISDIIESQYIHYFEMNGRFVPHFIVQFFDGITGKTIFDIANGICFMIFLHLTTKTICQNNNSQYYITLSITSILLFFFMPGFNYNFLWMSGACNYLWSATLLLSFNLLINKEKINKVYFLLLFIYGILCGWTHEGLVLGLGFGFIAHSVMQKKYLHKNHRKVLLAGFIIGIIFCIISPGSIKRAMESRTENSFNLINLCHDLIISLAYMDNIRLLPLLCIILCIGIVKKQINTCHYIRSNIVWLSAIFVNFGFLLLTKHVNAYSRFGFEFISMLLVLSLLKNINIKPIITHYTNSCIILFFLFFVIPACAKNYQEYRNVVTQIKKSPPNNIILTNNIKEVIPQNLERFIIHYQSVANSPFDIPFKGNDWIANYFKKEEVIFLPKDFIESINLNPEYYNNFYTTNNFTFYAKRLNSYSVSINKVYYLLNECKTSDIPFYHRPFAKKMDRYSANRIRVNPCYYSVININKTPYLLVGKNYIINQRVKEIIYE